jgi:hypothetical protein
VRAPAGLWKPFGVAEPVNPGGAATHPVGGLRRLWRVWMKLLPVGEPPEETTEATQFPPRQWPHF